MRKLALLLLLAGTVPPAFSAKSVTLEKVDQLLIHAHGKPDAERGPCRNQAALEFSPQLPSCSAAVSSVKRRYSRRIRACSVPPGISPRRTLSIEGA